MQVEIWSDVACPWCAVGKRRFEAALRGFAHADHVEVRWRSFELDPGAPAVRDGGYADALAAKYGTTVDRARQMVADMVATAAEEGLAFDFDRIRPGRTFDAHRLLHLAADRGVQDATKDRFLRGYLEEGAPIGLADALGELAVEAGLDRAEVRAVLAGDAYAEAVRADQAQARQLGITGVPFFVLDGRYGVSGAQPPALLGAALERAWDEQVPLRLLDGPAAEACQDGSCAV